MNGDVPAVLAISWGKGDPRTDAISLTFVDERGRMREHTKLDNLVDNQMRDEFVDLLKRRKPEVIAIAGFSMATAKLSQRVKEVLMLSKQPAEGQASSGDPVFDIPVVYAADDIARIYQHSKRAAEEFSALSPIARYCVGLARYLQSPLNEFAALGSDITAVNFDEDQNLVGRDTIPANFLLTVSQVPIDKLLSAFERVLVDITNKVGVNINRAVSDPYYQHILPFVCGLGPRKAQMLVRKIGSMVRFPSRL